MSGGIKKTMIRYFFYNFIYDSFSDTYKLLNYEMPDENIVVVNFFSAYRNNTIF